MAMIGSTCWLAQELKSAVQAVTLAFAIAVPLLNALPAVTEGNPPNVGVTSTRLVWLVPVHPTVVLPTPTATSLPARSVRLSEIPAVVPEGPEHSVVTRTLTPAPLATSVAGEFT